MLAAELNWYWIVIVAVVVVLFIIGIYDDISTKPQTKTRKIVTGVAWGVGAVYQVIIVAGLVVLAFLAFFMRW